MLGLISLVATFLIKGSHICGVSLKRAVRWYNGVEAPRARRPAARRLAMAGEELFSRKTSPAMFSSIFKYLTALFQNQAAC
jgi:hypothetical protein